jgi:aspartyl-tRNA(Asn)/glutamyl-tRNA(Gln) amidotransferase subunit A
MTLAQLPTRPEISDIHKIYQSSEVTVTEVVDYFLELINTKDQIFKSILRPTTDLAHILASKLDQSLDQARQNKTLRFSSLDATQHLKFQADKEDWFDYLLVYQPLFGIPFVIKDNILVESELATSASKMLENFKAPYSSDVFLKMQKAGAVLIGQSNMDEFAFGSSTEKSAFQVTRNPADADRVPGGTSGGSATAVALGLAPIALGTDTGGSIRQPASFCGAVGLRPTYGTVSRYGVMASASSFDQVGPITNSVHDNALVLLVLQGGSELDQTSLKNSSSYFTDFIQHPDFKDKLNLNRLLQVFFSFLEAFENMHGVDDQNEYIAQAYGYLATKHESAIKIGLPREYFSEGLGLEVSIKIGELVDRLSKKYEIIELNLPSTKYALSVYYILQTVEAAANMERYDGVRFAPSSSTEESLDPFFGPREKYLGEEVKRRIMLGTYTSSAGYYDAYYNKANQVKELIRQEFLKAFEQVDILITPTAPTPAFKIGDKNDDHMAMYLADIMTITQPPSKLPVLVVPLGETTFEGSQLPVGVQLIGSEFSEDKLFRLGRVIEKSVMF